MMSIAIIKRKYVTLIEILIVMLLISMIAGVVAYNYQGTIEKGKAFATEQTIEKIKTILTLRIAEDPSSLDSIPTNWKQYLKESPLVTNADKMSRDGWGVEFEVSVMRDNETGEPEITVTSRNYDNYLKNH